MSYQNIFKSSLGFLLHLVFGPRFLKVV